MSTELVSYAQAKEHLRLPDDREQTDVERKLAEATAIVLGFVDRWENDWSVDTHPTFDQDFARVQAAILYQLGKLWRQQRGDEPETRAEPPAAAAYLDANLLRILYPLRSPTIA